MPPKIQNQRRAGLSRIRVTKVWMHRGQGQGWYEPIWSRKDGPITGLEHPTWEAARAAIPGAAEQLQGVHERLKVSFLPSAEDRQRQQEERSAKNAAGVAVLDDFSL